MKNNPEFGAAYKQIMSEYLQKRIGSVAVCGDIKEMFHQVVVAEEDRCSQKLLWRYDASGPPEVYEMLVMMFGAACSPCIAYYVKETNAMEHRNRFPRAVKSILDHHYVDDFVDSFVNPSNAIEIAIQVREIHKAAGLEMLRRHSVLWDEMLPASLQAMWNKWRQELRNVVHVKVPRFYFGNGLLLELELHIFVDASEAD
ncbi:uncharacterized protein LOC135950533 [Calliphora vicina]|uniref:uncharacterized protein LOC135950533 n=1 Tax=Calliphora vicina TaxID=7373 RepID=UPI00325B4ECA